MGDIMGDMHEGLNALGAGIAGGQSYMGDSQYASASGSAEQQQQRE